MNFQIDDPNIPCHVNVPSSSQSKEMHIDATRLLEFGQE